MNDKKKRKTGIGVLTNWNRFEMVKKSTSS